MTEEEDYISLTDLAQEIGLKRTSLYHYLAALNIQTHRFPLNKNAYITRADAERIKAVKKHPWTVTQEKKDAN